MSETRTYQIGQLAAEADVTPRTIRFYQSEGLLPLPRSAGRAALYNEEHLARLKLIARLKAAFLPLSEIRARLAQMTADELEDLASARRPPAGEAQAEHDASPGRPAGTAAEYVRRLLAERERSAGGPHAAAAAPAALGAHAGGPEQWARIAVAPDVEVHARLPLSAEARELLDEIAALSKRVYGSS